MMATSGRTKLPLIFLAILVGGNAVPTSDVEEGHTERNDHPGYSSRMVDGTRARLGQFKSAVTFSISVHFEDEKGAALRVPLTHCTGTIISPLWILTAAHCLPYPFLRNLAAKNNRLVITRDVIEVVAGCINERDANCQRYLVERYFAHDNVTITFENLSEVFLLNLWSRPSQHEGSGGMVTGVDVALLKLKERMEFNENVGSNSIMSGHMPKRVKYCVSLGFGESNMDLPGSLLYVNVTGGNERFCGENRPKGSIIETYHVCSVNLNGKGGILCYGDTGSSILCKDRYSEYIFAGVARRGRFSNCGSRSLKKYSDVSTSTGHVEQWIREVTENDTDIVYKGL